MEKPDLKNRCLLLPLQQQDATNPNMKATKPFYQSTTIQGSVLALIPLISMIMRSCGIDIVDTEVSDILYAIVGIVGIILTVWGRFKAKTSLTLR